MHRTRPCARGDKEADVESPQTLDDGDKMTDTANQQGSPSSKKIFILVVGLAALLTLVLVHLTGQWVGQRMFANELSGRHRLKETGTQTRLQSRRWKVQSDPETAAGDSPGSSEKHSLARHKGERKSESRRHDASDWREIFLAEDERDQTIPKDSRGGHSPAHSAPGHQITNLESAVRAVTRESLKGSKAKKAGHGKINGHSYSWNDRDRNSHLSLPLRNTTESNWKRENALIFNRVGKCGSRSVIDLLRKLAKRNHFNLVSSTVYNSTAVSTDWQNYIAKTLDQMQTPYLYQRHLFFLDFTTYGARQPAYINIIRDPISRFVSNYYFKRFGDGRSDQKYKGSEEAKYRSISKCVLENHLECSPKGLFYIIPFFCGQLKKCRFPSQWALDRAKLNVEKHFVTVGILEDLEGTFMVFEKVMPHFFKGMVQLFREPDEKQTKKNSSTLTKFKEKPSPEAQAVMRTSMKFEYDFYYFVKDRLARMKEAYGIKTEIKQHR